jgi:hypothetical protein
MSRLAATDITVKGTLIVDCETPPFLPVNAPSSLRRDVDAVTFALPVSLSFQTTAPVEFTLLALQDGVIPFGSPEIATAEPIPPEAAATPPTGVNVTVAMPCKVDGMEIAGGEIVSTAPAAGFTCKVKLVLWLRPSPAAVTTRVTGPTGALVDAASVNVSLLVLTLAGGVCGLADHFAVTPAGSRLTE